MNHYTLTKHSPALMQSQNLTIKALRKAAWIAQPDAEQLTLDTTRSLFVNGKNLKLSKSTLTEKDFVMQQLNITETEYAHLDKVYTFVDNGILQSGLKNNIKSLSLDLDTQFPLENIYEIPLKNYTKELKREADGSITLQVSGNNFVVQNLLGQPLHTIPGTFFVKYTLTKKGFELTQVNVSNALLHDLVLGNNNVEITAEKIEQAQLEENLHEKLFNESLYAEPAWAESQVPFQLHRFFQAYYQQRFLHATSQEQLKEIDYAFECAVQAKEITEQDVKELASAYQENFKYAAGVACLELAVGGDANARLSQSDYLAYQNKINFIREYTTDCSIIREMQKPLDFAVMQQSQTAAAFSFAASQCRASIEKLADPSLQSEIETLIADKDTHTALKTQVLYTIHQLLTRPDDKEALSKSLHQLAKSSVSVSEKFTRVMDAILNSLRNFLGKIPSAPMSQETLIEKIFNKADPYTAARKAANKKQEAIPSRLPEMQNVPK